MSSHADWPPLAAFGPQHLEPSEWSYLAEGGKSLLLRFVGDPQAARNGWTNHNATRALALRLMKKSRRDPQGGAGTAPNAPAQSVSHPSFDRQLYETDVLKPLLQVRRGSPLVPASRRIDLSATDNDTNVFLRKVSGRVEIHRPRERRATDGIDLEAGYLEIVEDMTWTGPGSHLLAVEIKPKWLFKPDTSRYSRYRRQQVLKRGAELTKEDFEAMYDPLDLVSGDTQRIHKAAAGLVTDWRQQGNNLRLFVDGVPAKVSACARSGIGRNSTSV